MTVAHDLQSDLRRLDGLLAHALEAAERAYGADAAADRFRGLHLGFDEVARSLAHEPGVPLLARASAGASDGPDAGPSRPLAWLGQAFGLSPFELDVVLLALAPEVDARYERLYAYLQDDVSRRRPSVDLALHLLCTSAEERLERRSVFTADAPLVRNDVLRVTPDATVPAPTFLKQALVLDEQIVRLVLGTKSVDSRLVGYAEIVAPTVPLAVVLGPSGRDDGLRALLQAHVRDHRPLRLHFHGTDTERRRRAAEAVAAELDASLIVLDIAALPEPAAERDRVLRVALREALLIGAVLYLDGIDRLTSDERTPSWWRLLRSVAEHPGIFITAGFEPLRLSEAPAGTPPIGFVSLTFERPDYAERRRFWETALPAAGISLPSEDVRILANRFRLTTAQITEAAVAAWGHAAMRPASAPQPAPVAPVGADVLAAARACGGGELGRLARRIRPRQRWCDLVLPSDVAAQLRELQDRGAHQHRVLSDWGFEERLSLGKGIAALFSGPSGTGKTMAAEIVAGELGLDLYKVDLSGVVSKWIGETEKNLDRIFKAAESSNGILFFDEADAIFGKRSEIRDSHDRYANLEVSYLLQKMEEYCGIAILATNLRANLDDAFVRRLSFCIHFPFPDAAHRLRIWKGIFPANTPLAPDLDVATLARDYKLSGGAIKNVALAAAFRAAACDTAVSNEHLFHAVRREYQKIGRELGALREAATSPVESRA